MLSVIKNHLPKTLIETPDEENLSVPVKQIEVSYSVEMWLKAFWKFVTDNSIPYNLINNFSVILTEKEGEKYLSKLSDPATIMLSTKDKELNSITELYNLLSTTLLLKKSRRNCLKKLHISNLKFLSYLTN